MSKSNSISRRERLAKRKAILQGKIKPPKSYDVTIQSPNILSLEENYKETCQFLMSVRYHLFSVSKKPLSFMIDLSTCKEIHLSAALLLVAEFDSYQRAHHTKLSPDNVHEWHPSVIACLAELGFFKLLGTNIASKLKRSENRFWIPFVSGTQTIGKAARLLRMRLENQLGRQTGLYTAISGALIEAMNNVFQHAYDYTDSPPEYFAKVGARWWMTGAVAPDGTWLHVAFLDLGITIPRSLPRSKLWESIQNIPKISFRDDVAIAGALTYRESRLGQSFRGKGFTDIIKATKLNDKNLVRILSRYGRCDVSSAGIIARQLQLPLGGTLIQWYFALESGEN